MKWQILYITYILQQILIDVAIIALLMKQSLWWMLMIIPLSMNSAYVLKYLRAGIEKLEGEL